MGNYLSMCTLRYVAEKREMRTKLGKRCVSAHRGLAGEECRIFSDRLQFADGALQDGDLSDWVARGFQFGTDLIFEV